MSKNLLFLNKLYYIFNQLILSAQEKPKVNKLITFISNYPCGITDIDISYLIHDAKLGIIINNCLFIGRKLITKKELNNIIYEISILLERENIIQKTSIEFLDVFSNYGNIICKIPRSIVRILGLHTKAVHLNGFTKNNKIYISQRSVKKIINPNKLNTLVSGLVSHNEKVNVTLERESFEEAKIYKNQLYNRSKIKKLINIYKNIDYGFQNEEILSSNCLFNINQQFKNQDGEISNFFLLSYEDLLYLITKKYFTIESSLVLLDYLISYYKYKIK
ncbi:hypothetical protein CKSOR_00036 [Candidatus Kinetoplastibacterium sorsogonicusi]|uniref:Nudix hydrolase domain-containing protein n=1 Tax=Candidatus Kinetoplastidibacterium kentomonadis TaxID=1576550 RepID=A0A3Q8F617_9PROT|nr:hypothetical protein [Candidatus Kinetoplastibacterium sorsogonicusi]AWD32181.1 hypothetical protein CKSOR_00036 [Candidatus Kinetoplastibacterium sorsogonicusi]